MRRRNTGKRKMIPIFGEIKGVGVVEEETLPAVGGITGEGRDERGGHKTVHEVKLLGPCDAPAAGETEREEVAGYRAGGALHRHRRFHVQLPPPASLLRPPQPPHPPSLPRDYAGRLRPTRAVYGLRRPPRVARFPLARQWTE
ncbi:hypothetical protein BHE74_00021762 [Ensete ventricosum]|nr:hypothetical protein BHE74_00021762 [Ensete ventricosum]